VAIGQVPVLLLLGGKGFKNSTKERSISRKNDETFKKTQGVVVYKMVSAFRGVIEFFDRIGIYDVVLPFLLVFAIVFAILEKSRVLGVENVGGKELTRKNINSMVAFVISFLVIASSEIVRVLNESLANMVVLLMLATCFLILLGVFYKGEEKGFWLEGGWKTLWIFIMFIGIVLIFMNALGWLVPTWQFLYTHYDSTVVGSVILIGIVIGMMYAITKTPSDAGAKK